MKYVVLIAASVLVLGSHALAQEESAVGTVDDASTTEAGPAETAPASKEDKRSPYYKKVEGLLRIEGGAGPSSYDVDQLRAYDGSGGPSVGKVKGPEYSLSAGVGLGGLFLGGGFRWADYGDFNLLKVGLDIQGIFRFIPYVHPMVRINLFYAGTRNGSPITGLDVMKSNGGGFTLGAGIRVPIVRWISFATTFDWSLIGLGLKGTIGGTSGTSETSAVVGQQFTGMFVLTFQFIGVRKDG